VTKNRPLSQSPVTYKSILIFGKAVILKEIAEKKRALDIIMHHYYYHNSPSVFHYPEDILEKVIIIKIKVEKITGKESL